MVRGHTHAYLGGCLEAAGGGEEFDVWGFEAARASERGARRASVEVEEMSVWYETAIQVREGVRSEWSREVERQCQMR